MCDIGPKGKARTLKLCVLLVPYIHKVTATTTENASSVFFGFLVLCWFQLVLFGFLSFRLRPRSNVNVLIRNKQTNGLHMSFPSGLKNATHFQKTAIWAIRDFQLNRSTAMARSFNFRCQILWRMSLMSRRLSRRVSPTPPGTVLYSTWPGNSPDLNPIENCWNWMKDHLQEKKVTSIKNLIEEIKRLWCLATP